MALRPAVAADIRAIFNAPDRAEADHLLAKFLERYERTAPKLVQWGEENLPQGFTVFDFPPSHRRRLRTTNLLERMEEEVRRRTRVAKDLPQRRVLPAPGHGDRDGNFRQTADNRYLTFTD